MTEQAHSETVSVQVERLLPFGLLVRLADGREGLIRAREISWELRQRQRWRERFRPGETLRAVLLDEGLDQRIELSLRLTENDPWASLAARYQLGQRIDGVVTGVQPYGAFVELEPGITGLLHVTRLPLWAQSEQLHELLWVGDRVRVAVERIDLGHRRLGLSLVRALARRWEVAWAQLLRQPGPHAVAARDDAPAEPPAPDEREPLWRIVVIEDDRAYRDALVRWLERLGHQVRSAATAEDGLMLVEAEQPDLLLSDWGLPTMSGAEGALRVRRRWPGVRCALMTDWTRTSESLDELAEVRDQNIPVLLKPLRPDDLTGLLHEHAPPPEPALVAPALSPEAVEPTILDMLREPQPAHSQLRGLLERLRRRAGASKAVLFALDVVRRQVAIVAEAGSAPLNLGALADLIYSPVRDVAEDGRSFHLGSAHEGEPRVRYLLPLLPFRACLGLPLPVELPERYALFVFHAREREGGPHVDDYHAATAIALAALLERENFRSHALDTQRLALLGQLSRALVHEVNHRLSPVNFVLSEIAQLVENLDEPRRGPQQLEQNLRHLREAVGDLALGVDRLTETAQMFGRVMVQSREQGVQLALALHETVELTRDMADRSRVRVGLELAPELPALVVPAVPVQQMLLNMVVNAVQQIARAAPAQGGHIMLRAAPAEVEGKPVARIVIEDDGPGIHRQLWERVFELGFTTRREGGSGLGLYITRSLASALGARVYIAESLMLWGTTFVVELPAVDPRGE